MKLLIFYSFFLRSITFLCSFDFITKTKMTDIALLFMFCCLVCACCCMGGDACGDGGADAAGSADAAGDVGSLA